MDETSIRILHKIGLLHSNVVVQDLTGVLILRDILLDNSKYEELLSDIIELRKKLSSSSLTCLQKNAETKQRWPILNLVRQILGVYGYGMKPIRKANGYTVDGVKKFIRYFEIHKNNQ